MIYLASPYSHPDPEVRQWRHDQIEKYIARELRPLDGGLRTFFSPIMHFHSGHVKGLWKGDADTWRNYNEHMMRMAHRMFVLKIPGWENSRGVTQEIKFWTDFCNGKPLVYVKP